MSNVPHAHPRVPEEPHGQTVPMPHHHVPYYQIFFALVALTVVTVAVAILWRAPNELLNVLVALAIASVKATLVARFFMHLKYEGKLIFLILMVPLVLTVILVCALIPDLVLTHPASHSASLHWFNDNMRAFDKP